MPDAAQALLDGLRARQQRQENAPPPRVAEEPTVEIETGGKDTAPERATRVSSESGVTTRNVFRHPEAHPYVLALLLLRKYGPEWMLWEPETVEGHIAQDFHGGVSDLTFSKIQAVKTLHLVDTFWQNWEVFVPCVLALNGHFPDFEMLRPPTVAQCAVAVDMANMIRDDVDWSPEIKTFIATVFLHDGLFCPMEPLDFVTVSVEGLPVDRGEILRRWPGVRGASAGPADDSITSEQLRRMQTVYNYLEEYRTRLKRQLPIGTHA